jgi:putative two-component system response regulator
MPNGPILIVDDEPTNPLALRHALADAYPLVFANKGSAALAAARKHLPALILLDIEMPDMDGYAVCRELKANPALGDTPVIFVTSRSQADGEELGFEVGAVDYITKPISPAIVRARVRNHLSLVRHGQLEQSHRDALSMLGRAGHYNDTDTGVHIWRMASYSRALAEACGWRQEDCALLELAAPMHDTGKIGISDAILRKPGKLDADEWALMKTHSQIGHLILSTSQAPVFSWPPRWPCATTRNGMAAAIRTACPARRSPSRRASSPWPTCSTPFP